MKSDFIVRISQQYDDLEFSRLHSKALFTFELLPLVGVLSIHENPFQSLSSISLQLIVFFKEYLKTTGPGGAGSGFCLGNPSTRVETTFRVGFIMF